MMISISQKLANTFQCSRKFYLQAFFRSIEKNQKLWSVFNQILASEWYYLSSEGKKDKGRQRTTHSLKLLSNEKKNAGLFTQKTDYREILGMGLFWSVTISRLSTNKSTNKMPKKRCKLVNLISNSLEFSQVCRSKL